VVEAISRRILLKLDRKPTLEYIERTQSLLLKSERASE